ncbi:MAG: glutamyl-tRNA reductase [Ruminococcus sp.]|nr:glutamyl-tRNA reductase [Ruminococcus sp.]
MNCLSIDHKRADRELRSRFAFSDQSRSDLAAELAIRGIGASVILCTCNRTELYFSGDLPCLSDAVLECLAAAGDTIPEEIAGVVLSYTGTKAALHLFRVASGIDSMIIGEDEILGQVKNAYQEAASQGRTDAELNTVFQAAITCAKRIKTETALSKSSVSAATLAANEAAAFGENVRVLVIGASGKIGSSVLKNLLSHKNVTAAATFRSHSMRAVPKGAEMVEYDRRYQYIAGADCVISATSSPHYTVTAAELRKWLNDGKKRLFIDLAVPADIDSSAAKLPGVELIGIDHFRELAGRNNELKMTSAAQAEEIIDQELDELRKKLIFRGFLPKLERTSAAIGRLTPTELIYRLRDELASDHFEAVLRALEGLGE